MNLPMIQAVGDRTNEHVHMFGHVRIPLFSPSWDQREKILFDLRWNTYLKNETTQLEAHAPKRGDSWLVIVPDIATHAAIVRT